jgi:Tol biopolymer transport system component
VSTDGKFLAFNRRLCRNGSCTLEIYVRNRSTGTTRLASVDNQGRPIPNVDSPSLSAGGGRFVAFSNAYGQDPILQVWLRDRYGHHTWQISVGPGNHPADHNSWGPTVSAHGRIVAFSSDADNLVWHDTNGNTDAFIRRLP